LLDGDFILLKKSSIVAKVGHVGRLLASKAHPAGFRTIAQLRRLALSGPSIKRKVHESVMSSVTGPGLKR
jgi:hypothetical protein